MSRIVFSLCVVVAVLGSACAPKARVIPGTKIPSTEENTDLIKLIERYRQAVERKDAAALLLMASKRYYEDGGTQTGTDDYGYEQLKDVLVSRFQRAKNIRYSLRYLTIRRRAELAFVEVFIDASFTLRDSRGGTRREDVRDQNQIVLVREGDSWKFVSGM